MRLVFFGSSLRPPSSATAACGFAPTTPPKQRLAYHIQQAGAGTLSPIDERTHARSRKRGEPNKTRPENSKALFVSQSMRWRYSCLIAPVRPYFFCAPLCCCHGDCNSYNSSNCTSTPGLLSTQTYSVSLCFSERRARAGGWGGWWFGGGELGWAGV